MNPKTQGITTEFSQQSPATSGPRVPGWLSFYTCKRASLLSPTTSLHLYLLTDSNSHTVSQRVSVSLESWVSDPVFLPFHRCFFLNLLPFSTMTFRSDFFFPFVDVQERSRLESTVINLLLT
jgi:hypothetical protein